VNASSAAPPFLAIAPNAALQIELQAVPPLNVQDPAPFRLSPPLQSSLPPFNPHQGFRNGRTFSLNTFATPIKLVFPRQPCPLFPSTGTPSVGFLLLQTFYSPYDDGSFIFPPRLFVRVRPGALLHLPPLYDFSKSSCPSSDIRLWPTPPLFYSFCCPWNIFPLVVFLRTTLLHRSALGQTLPPPLILHDRFAVGVITPSLGKRRSVL